MYQEKGMVETDNPAARLLQPGSWLPGLGAALAPLLQIGVLLIHPRFDWIPAFAGMILSRAVFQLNGGAGIRSAYLQYHSSKDNSQGNIGK